MSQGKYNGFTSTTHTLRGLHELLSWAEKIQLGSPFQKTNIII